MKCSNCGFISFKSSSKCASCGTKLEKADSNSILANQEPQAFSIFAAPVPSIDIESIADEMKEIFTAPDPLAAAKVAQEETPAPNSPPASASGPNDEKATEEAAPEDFDLDLSDMAPEEAAQTGEPDAREQASPAAPNADDHEDIPDAMAVDLSDEGEPPDLEVEGLGFESSETELTSDDAHTAADDAPAEATEAAATDDIEIDLEPELAIEPAEDTQQDTAPESAEITGDVEFNLEPELEIEPAEDTPKDTQPESAEIIGDVEFNFEPT